MCYPPELGRLSRITCLTSSGGTSPLICRCGLSFGFCQLAITSRMLARVGKVRCHRLVEVCRRRSSTVLARPQWSSPRPQTPPPACQLFSSAGCPLACLRRVPYGLLSTNPGIRRYPGAIPSLAATQPTRRPSSTRSCGQGRLRKVEHPAAKRPCPGGPCLLGFRWTKVAGMALPRTPTADRRARARLRPHRTWRSAVTLRDRWMQSTGAEPPIRSPLDRSVNATETRLATGAEARQPERRRSNPTPAANPQRRYAGNCWKPLAFTEGPRTPRRVCQNTSRRASTRCPPAWTQRSEPGRHRVRGSLWDPTTLRG
jgi:hypothetical protein